jgi:hypothetical protein
MEVLEGKFFRGRQYKVIPYEDRFMRHVSPEPNSGCWLWEAHVSKEGYGRFHTPDGRHGWAHRISYELFKGSIPNGLHLDHLCRVRCCVNPDHLEPVTQTENNFRGESHIPKNKVKTHCKNGHEFNEKNTYWFSYRDTMHRKCRACRSATMCRIKSARRKAVRDARNS